MSRVKIKKLRQKKRHAAPGASPGTLVMPLTKVRLKIQVMSYDAETLEERTIERLHDLKAYIDNKAKVTWIDVRGLADEAALRELAQLFHIHPLALEDVVHTPQRPKTEHYEHHQFIISRMVMLRSKEDMEAEQVSIFLGRNYVLSFQEDTPDCFEPVRERIRRKNGIHRHSGADYLCYSILDAIVDNYFPVLEVYGEYLEQLEEHTVTAPVKQTLSQIHTAKRELLDLRRVLWPQRDMINQLIRDESEFFSPNVRVFLRDCHDHSVHVMDMVETAREVMSGLHDVYLSSIANRTNEIMKVLTIISTIFIPLTFIAGVYGMNFHPDKSPWNMPELEWYYGYPLCLGVMFLIGVSLLYYFWNKGWIFADTSSAVATPYEQKAALSEQKENGNNNKA